MRTALVTTRSIPRPARAWAHETRTRVISCSIGTSNASQPGALAPRTRTSLTFRSADGNFASARRTRTGADIGARDLTLGKHVPARCETGGAGRTWEPRDCPLIRQQPRVSPAGATHATRDVGPDRRTARARAHNPRDFMLARHCQRGCGHRTRVVLESVNGRPSVSPVRGSSHARSEHSIRVASRPIARVKRGGWNRRRTRGDAPDRRRKLIGAAPRI